MVTCSFVLILLDYCNSLLIDINCDQMYRLPKVQNHDFFFARADMGMSDHCSRHFTGCHSKTGLFLWQCVIDSHFCFPFFIIFNVPATMSEYTPRTLRSSSDGEKTLLVQDGNLWATGCSLFRLTVQNLFQNFSLYFCLPWNTLTLSQALDTFNLDFAASIFIDWCVWWWLFCGGGFFVLFVCCFLFYFLFLGWVDWGGERQRWKQWVVRLCACVCGGGGGGGGAVCNALLN